jgi:hypothetical protein
VVGWLSRVYFLLNQKIKKLNYSLLNCSHVIPEQNSGKRSGRVAALLTLTVHIYFIQFKQIISSIHTLIIFLRENGIRTLDMNLCIS